MIFNKTIIPLALVGYEMIIANSALRASLAIDHLISNARSWNNCYIYILLELEYSKFLIALNSERSSNYSDQW